MSLIDKANKILNKINLETSSQFSNITDGINEIIDSKKTDPNEIISVLSRATGTFSNADKVTSIGSHAFENWNTYSLVASFPNCSYIGDYAFDGCYNLATWTYFPEVKSIGGFLFGGRSLFEEVNLEFPKCEYISDYAFQSAARLGNISFPECKSIGSHAFEGCYYDWSHNYSTFLKCEYIGDYAFWGGGYGYFPFQSFPECSYIGNYAFEQTNTYNIYIPKCEEIGEGAFRYTTSMDQEINLPVCTKIGASAFDNSHLHEGVSAPMCQYIGSYAFRSCDLGMDGAYSGKAFFSFPACEIVGEQAFANNIYAFVLAFENCQYIGSYAFSGCASMSALFLYSSTSVCSTGAEIFKNTYHDVDIFVPSVILSEYLQSPYWSLYSSNIKAFE